MQTASTRELPKGPKVFSFSVLADSAGVELRQFPESA
jgi:hypothetical protein